MPLQIRGKGNLPIDGLEEEVALALGKDLPKTARLGAWQNYPALHCGGSEEQNAEGLRPELRALARECEKKSL